MCLVRGRWNMQALLARAAVGVVAAALACSSVGSAWAAGMPPEGIFENCPLDQDMQLCVQRLEVIAHGGFHVVVFPAAGASLGSLESYASAAGQLGVSVMWELNGPAWPPTSTSMAGAFSSFASACGCEQDGPLLSYVVGWLSSLPATYGYYAVDDLALAPGDRAAVAGYIAQIRQLDPAHPTMIGTANPAQTRTYQGVSDLIGVEIYPVTTLSLVPYGQNEGVWNWVGRTALDAQRSAERHHQPAAFILQAFTWGDNVTDGVAIGACSPSDSQSDCYAKLRYPTEREQLYLRNEVLLYGRPRLILWWSFPGTDGQAGKDTYSLFPTGATAAARWSGLTQAVGAPPPGVRNRYRYRTRPAA